jgi:hypothetical protein
LGKSKGGSRAVPVVIDFTVTAKLDEDGEWVDWSDYDDQTIEGRFYVVGKDGVPNVPNVERLARCLGWTPDVIDDPPPSTVVQIEVKAEEYNGRTTLKVQWLNPSDFVPAAATQSPAEVKAFKQQFGSQMRAIAAAATKGSGAKSAPPPARKPAPAPGPVAGEPGSDVQLGPDGLPF